VLAGNKFISKEQNRHKSPIKCEIVRRPKTPSLINSDSRPSDLSKMSSEYYDEEDQVVIDSDGN
jgi:hypothetical protein